VAAAANSVRPTATVADMPFPDDPDDDARFIPPLPPDDRLWRHPSEMSGVDARATPAATRGGSSRPALIAGIALLVGVAATLAILGATDSLGPTGSGTGSALSVNSSVEAVPAAVTDMMTAAVVQITADRSSGSVTVTGLMVRSDGHLVTTADGISDARSFTVTGSNGTAFNATLVGTDIGNDIAVLDIEGNGLPTATTGRPTDVTEGDTVFLVGRTADQVHPWATTGRVASSGVRLDSSNGSSLYDMIETGVASAPPISASVLCTSDGRVLGILTSRTPAVTSTATSSLVPVPFTDPAPTSVWAIPIAHITRIADDIIDTGTVHHPWLGVVIDRAGSSGALIRTVATNSPAARAGLSEGDVITSVDETPIISTDDLVVVLRSHHPGDTVTIGFARNSIATRITATLSDHS
jgi:S1-C subfamily serine protease